MTDAPIETAPPDSHDRTRVQVCLGRRRRCRTACQGYDDRMKLVIETEQEVDGRWIAEIPALPGVMVYGATLPEALVKVTSLATSRLLELSEGGESIKDVEFTLAA